MYKHSDILCPFCEQTDDSQRHMLDWAVLNKHIESNEASKDKVVYENLFKDHGKQKEVTALFMEGQFVKWSDNFAPLDLFVLRYK